MLCDRLNLQVSYGAGFIEFYAEEAKRVYGDIIPSPLADRRLFVLKQVILFIFFFLCFEFYMINLHKINILTSSQTWLYIYI